MRRPGPTRTRLPSGWTVCADLTHSFCPACGKSTPPTAFGILACPGLMLSRRTRFRNALAAENAKPRRKAGKRLAAATVTASVTSLTPPLQLFQLEGPQRAASVASKPVLCSRLHISGRASIAAGGAAPSYIDHVVRPGYKRPRAHAVGRSEALHRLPCRLGTFRCQSMLISR